MGDLGSGGDETRYVDELFEHFVPAAGNDRALTYHVTLGDRVIYSERRAWDPVAGDYVSSKRYLHHDHLGSVNVITNESQNVLQPVRK